MTTVGPTPVDAGSVAGPGAVRSAERVELLLARDDARGEGRPSSAAGGWATTMQVRRAEPTAGPDADLNVAPMQDVFAAGAATSARGGEPARARPPHPGLRQPPAHRRRGRGRAGAPAAHRPRRLAPGIPAIVHEECLTGFTAYGATVYPAAIAWGATFDPDLVERMAAAIGRDMAAVGVHQGCRRSLDVVRDYRWGRVEETMGEDPYLVAVHGLRLRARPAERRGDRHPEALRRATPPPARAATTGRSRWAGAS